MRWRVQLEAPTPLVPFIGQTPGCSSYGQYPRFYRDPVERSSLAPYGRPTLHIERPGRRSRPLGAAARMGRRDIALYRLGRGARLDLFAAAMLGEGAIVRALLQRFPELRDTRGPHRISLMDHVKAGVLRFLEQVTPTVE
jgi:hypothetical protein